MELEAGPVKSSRRYSSPRREEQARRTRHDVLAAAEYLFRRQGFAATTVVSIATRAEVSVETVYKVFGGKPGLVRAICEQALAGQGPVAAEVRSDALQERESDPRQVVRGWGRLSCEVAPRVAPLLLLLREAAATDAEMRALQAEMDDRRLARMTHNAESLAAHLRPDVSVAHAAEVLWTYSSAEMYELLVLKRGWPLERFGSFVAEAMIAALLRPTSDS